MGKPERYFACFIFVWESFERMGNIIFEDCE
jgi:hypothetical protein